MSATIRIILRPAARRVLDVAYLFILFTFFTCGAAAQTTTTTTKHATDGHTPLEIAPGSPAGSYPLSGFDSINLFNQSLGFRLPLLRVGGRGEAGYAITLPIERKWRVEHKVTDPSIGCGGCEQFLPEHNYRPETDWYAALKPGFSPGVLLVRPTGLDPLRTGSCQGGYLKTLTRLTFVAPDGTEYELRDTRFGGSPRPALVSCTEGENRGREFVTADGSSATFVSDADIKDRGLPLPDADGVVIDVSGYLYLRDGTRYRIGHNRVEAIRDRNGNEVRYYYSVPAEGQPGVYVEKAVDSTGREVIINPATNEITYKGFGGAARTIRVLYAWLGDRLRQANDEHGAETIQSFGNLFPSLPVNGPSDGGYMAADFDVPVVSEVVLPDNRRYGFRYNSYGELARVELPTGGAFEYDYQDGDGVINLGEEYEVFRRVVRKRVYREGGQLEGVTTFTPAGTVAGPGGFDSVVQVDQLDPDPAPSSQCALPLAGKNYRLISRSLHYYHGMAGPGLFTLPTHYTKWNEGREFKTETYACDGTTLLRRVEQDWRQKASVGWWTAYNFNERGPEPSNDPRMVETRATLADTGQMAKTTSINPLNSALVGFDQYNNPTDVWEYDYGGTDGAVGQFLRRRHNDYVDTPAYTAVTGAHIRGLPEETWVSSDVAGAAANRVSRTALGYDEFPLEACPDIFVQGACSAIAGHDAAYGSNLTARGNQTSVTSYADASGVGSGPVTTTARYDVTGNVVKAYDALGRETLFGFGDNFGAPNGEARTNTAPAELAGLPQATRAYAFPTKVVNAAGHVGHTQYDYYLGRAVEGEDANGVLTLLYYDDLLDRLRRGVRAYGTAEQSQTTITYNDAGRTVTATSDLRAYDDNLLKSETVYDGLGRTIQSRRYENATQYILSEQRYDALGRAAEASNPYRPYQGEAAAWTRTEYDALGRATAVTTPDGAKAGTRYHGARTLVTDQAGRKRVSEADAQGRLSKVWEVTGQDVGTVGLTLPGGVQAHGYLTAYGYDELGNLRTVTQGAQTRTFLYDSLSRLTSATNPEVCRQEQSGCVPVPVTFDHYADGSLHHRTDARGVVTTYGYDALGRITSRAYSDSTPPVSYFYDGQALPEGAPAFDRGLSVGRLVAVTYGAGSTAGSYLGDYDAMGRPRLSRQRTDTGTAEGMKTYEMAYGYDLAGNLRTEKYPSGKVFETSYDGAGRVAGVMKQATAFYYAGGAADQGNRIQYAAHGGVAKMRLGNGLWEHTTFNSRLQWEQSGLGSSTGIDPAKLRLTFGYGAAGENNGNLRSQRIEGGGLDVTQTYEYDTLNRLQWAEEKAGTTSKWKQVFSYDRYGNRNFAQGTTSPDYSPTPNDQETGLPVDPVRNPVFDAAANRVKVTASGQDVYSYDEAGNLKCDAEHQCATGGATSPPDPSINRAYFDYDAENRMVRAGSGGAGYGNGGSSYTYNGEGRRVTKAVAGGEVTVFVYDAVGRVVAEYSNQVEARGTHYLTQDHLGSTRVVTDAQGNAHTDAVAGASGARHDYFPFGEEIEAPRAGVNGYSAADNTHRRFTGYERDPESGLDYAQARYYSSAMGRFTSPDAFWKDSQIGDPQSWNKYAYVRNNPLSHVDPTGEKGEAVMTTSRDGKVVNVRVKISIAIWTADKKVSSKLETAAKKIEKLVEDTWKGTFVKNGVTYNLSTDATVKADRGASSEAAVSAKDPSIQNVIEMRNGILGRASDGTIVNSAADFYKPLTSDPRSPDGTGPDTGDWNINEALRGSPEPAHETGHLLGPGDNNPAQPGLHVLNQGAGMGRTLTQQDFFKTFGSVLLSHQATGTYNVDGTRTSTYIIRVPPHAPARQF
ncbi:MAG TPA: RHS repeat-associated core domain-containing protein [Pyrinomonadaceae bacterium]|jgi:RHS repeat-associated protein